MEKKPNSLGALFENAGDYVETRIDLLKLKAINKSSEVISSLVAVIAIIIAATVAVLLLNIALALWVGDLLGRAYLGFLVVAGIYLLLALLIHFFKDTWLKGPVSNIIIKKMLN
ncbi:MAG: phage holin family protein [Ferruginibacter sp.]